MQADRPYDVMIEKKIANLAYCYWEQRGRPNGSSEVDWYRAADDVDREQHWACAGVWSETAAAITAEPSPSSTGRDRTVEIADHYSKPEEFTGE